MKIIKNTPEQVLKNAPKSILADFRNLLSKNQDLQKALNICERLASRKPDVVTFEKYGCNIQERSQIIVTAADSKIRSISAVAKALGLNRHKVQKWLARFTEDGVEGLRTKRKPRTVLMTDERKQEVTRLLTRDPSSITKEDKYKHLDGLLGFSGTKRWTVRALAKCIGVSEPTMSRYISSARITLDVSDNGSYCSSTDPDFELKLTAIAKAIRGVVPVVPDSYMPVYANYRVISVDEKTCISAVKDDSFFNFEDQLVPGSRWKRNGITHLIAALDVQTGKIVHYRFKSTKNRKDFKEFLEELYNKFPNERLMVILDNYCTHKRLGEEWLAAHPNFTFLFTPIYCSWANPVESFFGILQKGCLRTRQWDSVEEIHEYSGAFIKAYNRDARAYHFDFDIEKFLAQRKHNLYNLNKVLAFELNSWRARKSRLASAYISALRHVAEQIYRLEHPDATNKEVKSHGDEIETELKKSS